MSERFDVVVAGAGTAGAYAAYLLAKAGFRVALLESKSGDQIGVKTCGDGLGLHHVERMSKNLTPNPKVFQNKIEGVELFSPDERTRLVVRGEGYVLDRFAWGKWLVEEAVRAGASLFEGYTATGPIVENGAVVGVKAVDRKTGSAKEFLAKVVADATGSAAVVRTKLAGWLISEPLHPEDVSHAYREIVYVEEPVENPQYIKIYLDQTVSPGGYWWIFPRSATMLNVGLGIWGILKQNPRTSYEKAILPRFKVRGKYHIGGGFIPTRRPLKSLVGNGIVALGDAAAAVNPIHGGGIGQALLTAELSSRVIAKAFERGDFSESALWEYNVLYMREWGYRQAQLDVLRLMLQTLDNDDLNFGLSRRILTEDEIYHLAAKGTNLSLLDKFRVMMQFLGRPALLKKLSTSIQYAKEIGDLYLAYPESREGLERWYAEVVKKYNEFREKIGLGPLPTA
ncbi:MULTISPECIES: digeranylgeranylglycerophospholipid reductase [Pyrobaculum]|uniref:2,3-di-O-geranylgeranylglyceryl phosphate reductase n=3 Tax=Pyrobaculum TaxID=2276 RepID=A4WJ30_PYRAR|nr:digeranylgeranylglycerophospholipid reductase [Pyrobaculum arsenaticum]ABP50397.1 2,3-di-O-geranylgeranylglyceryl phosphate reductase [Pyrobaculum arsenaticum DSM 13514]AFA39548.1 geranylgeranyl reductase family [Pyrobaculum oguniense TE7]MCY0890385.1 digeranylgeranylglycerophospholipid reductase [Pyrobaculum arsenaticum]NYR14659.1 NAD(P)/FAD-dependent oxidoreductase [Pyrobaculum arsenaticum]